MERAVLILSALALNAVFAGPARLFAALGLMPLFHYPASKVRDLERRLNRDHRSYSEREMRGVLLVSVMIIVALLVGAFLEWLFAHNLQFMGLLLVALLLPVRPTWDCVWAIRKYLASGDLRQTRDALADTAWRHHALLDEYGVARAGIETVAVHFAEKIFAPALWYIIFGLPGFLVSKGVYLLQETLSRPSGENGFARATAGVHYVLHYIPSRIAAVFWLAAAFFVPGANAAEAARQLVPGIERARPEKIALLSAASVLKLGLGGPSSIYVHEEWVGNGTVKPTAYDVRRALYIFIILHLMLFVLFGLFL